MEKEKTKVEIKEVETRMKIQTEAVTFNTITNKITVSLKSFQQDLQWYKLRKYEQDTKDYADGFVYNWKDDIRKLRKPCSACQRNSRVRLPTSASEWDSPQASDVEIQHDTRHFFFYPMQRLPDKEEEDGEELEGTPHPHANNISDQSLSNEETKVLS